MIPPDSPQTWWTLYSDNKQLVIALVAAIVGAILTKLIPTLWSWLLSLVRFFEIPPRRALRFSRLSEKVS